MYFPHKYKILVKTLEILDQFIAPGDRCFSNRSSANIRGRLICINISWQAMASIQICKCGFIFRGRDD